MARRLSKRRPFSQRILPLFVIGLGLLMLPALIPSTPFEVTHNVAAVAKAPSWNLTDTNGTAYSLSQFKDKKVVLIDLMAIACESCKIVTQNIKAIYPQYKAQVFVISVDVWNTIDSVSDLKKFKDDEGIPWPMALDSDSMLTKYSASNIAKVVIVDGYGNQVFSNTGVTDTNTMRSNLDDAIKNSFKPKAPDFNLTDTKGTSYNLRQQEGKKVVIINLMAMSWQSSRSVIDDLRSVYNSTKSHLLIISVDIMTTETQANLSKFRTDMKIPWPMAMDTDNMAMKYKTGNETKTIIIDGNSVTVYEKIGLTDKKVLKDTVSKAIKDTIPSTINSTSLWILAITAGVASFFSPCAFPMFPGYMAYYFKKNLEQNEKKFKAGKAVASGTVTALGIIAVYLIIGGLVLIVGSAIYPYFSKLQLVIGIILVFLGSLLMTNLQYDKIIDPFRKAFSGVGKDKDGKKKDTGFYAGLFTYGAGYGGASAACTLPVFLAVILTGISTGSLLTGLLLLLTYTFIAALLMIFVTVIIAVVGHQAVQKLAKYTNAIKKISGLVLLIVGVYLILFWLAANNYINIPGLG